MALRPAALIFDFDGTIIDTEWSEFVTLAAVMEHHGVPYTLDDHRGRVGMIDGAHWSERLVQHAGPIDDLDEVIRRRRAAHREMIESADLRPGIATLMERATSASVPMAVASSSPLSWVLPILEARDLAARFDAIVTGDQVERTKPAPDVFREAARRLGEGPEFCVAFEDSAPGVAAAKAAGMTCIAVPNPVTDGSDFTAADIVRRSHAHVTPAHLGL